MKKILLIAALFMSVVGVKAQQTGNNDTLPENMSMEEYAKYMKEHASDTSKYYPVAQRHKFRISVIARPKGDRVLLKWAPDQYVPWFFGNIHGYRLLRIDNDGNVDTLASRLKPMPLEEMKTHFAATDSLAGVAAQLVYGQGTTLNEAMAAEGAKGIMKVYEEQETRFAYAMLLTEIRPDLAKAMGLMWEDKNVKKGKTYEYIVASNIPDTVAYVSTVPISVKNEPAKPVAFEPIITDSIGTDGRSIRLFWEMNPMFSTYDIECRYNGGEWQKLNKNPFLTLITYEGEEAAQNIFGHNDLEVGNYEYRICGYDAFGDKSNYSNVHKVELRDIIGPSAPEIFRFNLKKDDAGDYEVDILWRKDTIEPDFVGYDIYYYHQKVAENWIKVNESLVSPNDTTYHYKLPINQSAYIMVAAVDTVGNYTPSLPGEVHITDLIAPTAPAEVKYTLSPSGLLKLMWTPSPEDDVSSYQVYKANNINDKFIPMKGKLVTDTVAFDTIPTKGQQRYLYYRVKAYDYSGNESNFSEILQVKRLNFTQPEPCRIDSLHTTEEYVYMSWYPSPERDIERFYVYRRLAGTEVAELIKELPVDSLVNGRIVIYDTPTPNDKQRYHYYIESMNATGVSSRPSLEVSTLFKGPRTIPTTITLNAQYRHELNRIVLAWDYHDLTQDIIDDGAYLCLYRKIEGEDYFRFIETLRISDRSTYDRRVPEGKSAEYQMRIITRSGKMSEYSNAPKATVPVQQEEMSN